MPQLKNFIEGKIKLIDKLKLNEKLEPTEWKI